MAEDVTESRELAALGRMAQAALTLWPVPDGARIRLINLSENATYLVQAPCGFRAVLRVHRHGYHSRRAIASELDWMDALERDAIVPTPRPIAGRDRQMIQLGHGAGLADPRHMVLFEFIDGRAPDPSHPRTALFESLGTLAARMHGHARTWTRPDGFVRLSWDDTAVFGPHAHWGDWRAAPRVDARLRPVLNEAEHAIRERLAAYGKGAGRFGLIHADMRLANLLVDGDKTRLIDFDDCGFGWFLYDFAAAISFIETDPAVPALKAAWLRGYRQVHPLAETDLAEIDTFVMLRRMALLAWIGSHMEAPEPQAMAPHFAAGTARLARDWLARIGN